MLWLDDLSNEGHIPAIYHDDSDDRLVFVRRDISDRRHRTIVAAEHGCIPVLRGLEWIGADWDQAESWAGQAPSQGRKAATACL